MSYKCEFPLFQLERKVLKNDFFSFRIFKGYVSKLNGSIKFLSEIASILQAKLLFVLTLNDIEDPCS
jgi:hypothetical protein